jgi:M6 family metalloprotease-like protein
VRLFSCIVGACLLFGLAPQARAVAPIYTEIPSLRGTHKAAAALDRLRRKPAGVDRAVRSQHLPVGHYRALVVLLQFPPDPAIPGDPGFLADTLAHPPEAYDSLFFSLGTQPHGSVRDYYREVSGGQFDLDGVVTRWYMAPHPYSYYVDAQNGFGDPPHNAQQMAHDALALADPDYDLRLFDNDGPDNIPDSGDDDGLVDGFFVVHAGPGGEETASPDDIHSHEWTLPTIYSSGDIGAHGAIRDSVYTTEPEKWVGLAPHTAPNLIMSIGTFCHEFGHTLGLPDLYDTSGLPDASEGIGEWDLMGSGNFNHAPGESLGWSPAHFSAWSKQTLGWITPTNVASDQLGATLQPVESGGAVYRLWTNGDGVGEYFLIENRQPIGFDQGLVRRAVEVDGVQAHGLLIYHVDESAPANNIVTRKLVDVVEAGGAESVSGPAGVQNLDVARNTTASESACGSSATVTGNRGDKFDPWPGALGVHDFSLATCPNTRSNCGDLTQVAIRNIAENAGVITADLRVHAAAVVRQAIQVDDSPRMGTTNDGDGKAEIGESIRLRIPLLNVNGAPTPTLYAKVTALDSYTTVTAGDSIDYGTIAPAQADSGTAVEVTVNSAPDPIGAWFRYDLFSTSGLALSDTVQILVGTKTGICDDFEGTVQPWFSQAAPAACANADEWHRESGQNHTPSGAWAWKLGPVGGIGSYAPNQDARLISQPVRLTGAGDTLTFWQRYGSAAGTDGVSVEISTDNGGTWTLLHPVPDYPFGDRWGGAQLTFALAKVPLAGYSGVVEIAFRFRSGLVGGGIGWWIDDVAVNGDANCGTTDVDIPPVDAQLDAARNRVVVHWNLGSAGLPTVGIDRAVGNGPREHVADPVGYFGPGSWEDADLTPGQTQYYWVMVPHDGGVQAQYGPVQVTIPAGSRAPRVLALGPVRPNPFNPEATLPVSLDRDGAFTLRVYRVDGVLARTLHDGPGTAGVYAFRWDGRDAAGRALPGGVYLIELKSASRTRVEKAILLR